MRGGEAVSPMGTVMPRACRTPCVLSRQGPCCCSVLWHPVLPFIGCMAAARPQGKYVVLFFYPKDFTFVCPTEIIAFSGACRWRQFKPLTLSGA